MLRWSLWQRVPVSQMHLAAPRREAAHLTLYAVAYVGLALLTGLLIRHWPLPIMGAWKFNHDVWYTLFFKFGMLLLVPCLWFFRLGYRPRHLLPGWRPGFRALLITALAFGMGFCLNLGHLPRIEAALGERSMAGAVAAVALGAVMPLFTAGLPEEIVYRGLLQTRLEATAGRLAALVVTAILFTSWHLPTRYLLSDGIEGTVHSRRTWGPTERPSPSRSPGSATRMAGAG